MVFEGVSRGVEASSWRDPVSFWGEPGSFLGPKMVILGKKYYFLMIIQGSSGIVFGNKFVHFEHN